ncbi:MAG: hypothetical protein N3A54_03880 [Patescibacteria group bacterium]|nr:hypothetical protein [Patescibacteria group bacterium]
MKAFEVYSMYLAVKLHFTSERYDYFLYNGHVSASLKAFDRRNDKYFFEYIAYNYPTDLLSRFVVFYHLNREFYIKDFYDWLKNLSSCSYWNKYDEFRTDAAHVLKMEMESMNLNDKYYGEPLYFFNKYMNKEILIETFLIINHKLNILKSLMKDYNPVLEQEVVFLKKYLPFSILKKAGKESIREIGSYVARTSHHQ